jgi:hypothetical protein
MPSGAPISTLYEVIELEAEPIPGGEQFRKTQSKCALQSAAGMCSLLEKTTQNTQQSSTRAATTLATRWINVSRITILGVEDTDDPVSIASGDIHKAEHQYHCVRR